VGVEQRQSGRVFEKYALLRQIAEWARGPVHAGECMQGAGSKPAATFAAACAGYSVGLATLVRIPIYE
jgi:hypothetical protein